MLVDLSLPPGVRAAGTARGTRGVWREANLVRWRPDLQPVGGWVARSTGAVSGKGRAVLSWLDNNRSRWTAVGTELGLFVMSASGVVHDITPVGFSPGRADAIVGGGFGAGRFGTGRFGSPRAGSSAVIPASVWTLDLWNDRLVGCLEGDGRLYQWDLDPGYRAVRIDGSPVDCSGLVVSENQILMALRDRTVAWSAQGDDGEWTASALNQAGDLDLAASGLLLCGRQVRGRTLLFTTSDVWEATYQGPPSVYGFQQAGLDCAPAAKGSPVVIDAGRCVWMGREGFHLYNGYVTPLDCDLAASVFDDLNVTQLSKVSGWHNARFGEVWWHYPSAGSEEVDRYVAWSYRDGTWMCGTLARTAGATGPGASANDSPLLIGTDGMIYAHETGDDYGGAHPFARSGDFEWPSEMGGGERRIMVSSLIPDQKTLGDCQVSFHSQDYPNLPTTDWGPYDLSGGPSDLMVTGRSVQMSVTFQNSEGRWGTPRLEVRPVSRR